MAIILSSECVESEALKMFSRFQHYYIRHRNKPIATVMVGIRRGSGRFCRGVSICSTIENFSRKDGWTRAMGRMVQAAKAQKSSGRIMSSRDRMVSGTKVGLPAKSVDRFIKAIQSSERDLPTVWKSGYSVPLTKKEKRILEIER